MLLLEKQTKKEHSEDLVPFLSRFHSVSFKHIPEVVRTGHLPHKVYKMTCHLYGTGGHQPPGVQVLPKRATTRQTCISSALIIHQLGYHEVKAHGSTPGLC